MDLREYERAKFEVAEILRSLANLCKDRPPEDQARLRELFVRLAEDRFNLVVVGRFSRGKTSLMNAILGTDRLPTGIIPLTSVITTVAYGSKEQVIISYKNRQFSSEVPLEALPDYVTQRGNPANIRQVKIAEVKLPAEILRRGFYFVDTPGLGSPIPENTRTTEEFLPEADAFVLVTSYESPLSEEELRVLRAASLSAHRVFVVLNKHDTVSPEERSEALRYLDEQLSELLGKNAPRVFSVSAREGLEAKRSRDAARLTTSGVDDFEAELVRFLISEKSNECLLRLCDRITDLTREWLPGPDASRLVDQVSALARRVAEGEASATLRGDEPAAQITTRSALPQLRPCEVCERIVDASFEFLCQYQYRLSTSPEEQQRHADRGGLCLLHTWQYASLVSPHGICTGYPALLDRLSGWFRHAAESHTPSSLPSAIKALLPKEETCVLCSVHAKAETSAIALIVDRLQKEPKNALKFLSAICLPHLRPLITSIDDEEMIRKLMVREAIILDRLSEDMRRYATKHDALRRFLASDEERSAGHTAITALAGLRNVNMAVKVS